MSAPDIDLRPRCNRCGERLLDLHWQIGDAGGWEHAARAARAGAWALLHEVAREYVAHVRGDRDQLAGVVHWLNELDDPRAVFEAMTLLENGPGDFIGAGVLNRALLDECAVWRAAEEQRDP
jgi:hypothetical protein